MKTYEGNVASDLAQHGKLVDCLKRTIKAGKSLLVISRVSESNRLLVQDKLKAMEQELRELTGEAR